MHRAQVPSAQSHVPTVAIRLTIAVAVAPVLLMEALTAVLRSADFDVTVQCAGSDDLVAAVAEVAPDVILVGAELDGGRPLRALGRARAAAPEACRVALVTQLTPQLALAAVREEVDGVIEGSATPHELAQSIRQIASGHTVFPAGWLALLRRAEADSLGSRLSARQIQVLELLARGMTNEEIARHLAISLNTVKFHLRQIYARVGVANRVQAAALLGAPVAGSAYAA